MKKVDSQKLLPRITIILATVFMFALCLLGYFEMKPSLSSNPAASISDLELHVTHLNSTQKIKIWQKESNVYYFFLPSYVNNDTILTFGNLAPASSVTLCNNTFVSKSNITSRFAWNVPHNMEFYTNETLSESCTITFCKSENIPSLYIQTETGSLDTIHSDKTIQEKASLTIKSVDGVTEYNHDVDYIRTRGKSSFQFADKKSYQIKLKQKAEILGMPLGKTWLLISNYIDNSLVRNQFVYNYVNNHTDLQTVQGHFIDLYINGEYLGNYLLCEKVDISESKLDIHDLENEVAAINDAAQIENCISALSDDGKIKFIPNIKSPSDISGGYLIVTNSLENAQTGFITNHGYSYEIVSPKNASYEQVHYIRSLFNEAEDAIFSADGINASTGKHFSQYIDIPSWSMRYLIEEVFHNPDGALASCYFYKDKDSVSPLLFAGPLWDYDRSLGSYGVSTQYIDSPHNIGYYSRYADALMQHEEFSNIIKSKFKNSIIDYVNTHAEYDINFFIAQLSASAHMDELRWPGSNDYYGSFQSSAEYIYRFLKERCAYLESVWLKNEQYHTITFLSYDGNIYEQYTIKHGDILNFSPQIASYVAIFNGWKNTSTGKMFNPELPILEDTTYQSQWIDASLVVENALAISELNIQDIDIQGLKAFLHTIEEERQHNMKEGENNE